VPTPTPTPAASTTFTGTIAGSSGLSGTLVIRIAAEVSSLAEVKAQAAATASATLTLTGGGGTFALSGSFDTVTKALSLSGSGFSLTGTIANGRVTGNYTGPNNSVGIFSNLDSTNQGVQTYCGTYVRVTETGVWNFQIAANGAVSGGGIATAGPQSIGAHQFFMTGTLNGTALTLTVDTGPDGLVGATGTVQGGSVSGSFVDQYGYPGTFSGGTC
jgi:hypothetical protein